MICLPSMGQTGDGFGRGITPVNELQERCVLQGSHYIPNGTRNRQGKEAFDILAQAVWFLKKARSDRVVRAAQMQNYENDKHFLCGGHSHSRQVSLGIEDACQLRLRVHPFPQVAMLFGQLDEVPDAASAGFKQGRNAYQEEPCGDGACLSERKPIVTHPRRRGHAFIIPKPRPESRAEEIICLPHDYPTTYERIGSAPASLRRRWRSSSAPRAAPAFPGMSASNRLLTCRRFWLTKCCFGRPSGIFSAASTRKSNRSSSPESVCLSGS